MNEPAPPSLADLRKEIDAADAQMHALLMRRGRVIDRLIEIKKRQGGGSAFRPLREAQMMRAIAERHRGVLPLDTVEGIWRIIISTFTYVQAPHSVHVDVARGDAPMRDSARFHFGFTVPCAPHRGAAAVIEAVAGADNDLGLLAVDAGPEAGAWWRPLEAADAPKVIARMPFVERPGHPAGTPVFVIAKPLADGGAREVVIEGVRVDRWRWPKSAPSWSPMPGSQAAWRCWFRARRPGPPTTFGGRCRRRGRKTCALPKSARMPPVSTDRR